jgi:transposase InsO family protein
MFGAPKRILSDNGGEFNNEEIKEFYERFNIEPLYTAAESPFSNGVVERLNAIIGDQLSKIMEKEKDLE